MSNRSRNLDTPLAPNISGNAQVALAVRHRLKLSEKQLSSHGLFYPRISRKLIGQKALANAKALLDPLHATSYESASMLDIERAYHQTGIRLSGPAEMRSAFKYSDLKPRVYYAQGPDTFHTSKVIQAIFNIMVDSFENTNTFLRHQPKLLGSAKDLTAVIYDYSSFTSSLHEIRNFTSKLADFFQDTIVTVVDSHYGPLEQSVGDILRAYNESCNISADFDVSALLEMTDSLLSHNCGMLGVPGNISSCTLLHGIHLTFIVGSLLRNRVVGDDAIALFAAGEPYEQISLVEALSNIGDVALSKTEFWEARITEMDLEDNTWHYVKRPVFRDGNSMIFGSLVIWPSLDNALNLHDDVHTTILKTEEERLKSYEKQVRRFYSSLSTYASIDENDVKLVGSVITSLHREFGYRRNGDIMSSLVGGHKLHRTLLPRGVWSQEWVDDMVEDHWNHAVDMPVEYDPTVHYNPDPFMTYGTSFVGPSKESSKLATDLGLLSRERMMTKVIVSEVEGRYRRMILGEKFRPLYHYVVISRLPEWVTTLLSSDFLLPTSVSSSME